MSATHMAESLEHLGVAPHVVQAAASTSGLRVLERAAELRASLHAHAAQMRAVGGEVHGGTLGHVGRRRAGEPVARLGADGREYVDVGAADDAAGGSVSAAEVAQAAEAAQADAHLAEALEEQLVQIFSACTECASCVVAELEHTHLRLARTPPPGGEPQGEAALTLLLDDRARDIRRSRDALSRQHDMLTHLIARRWLVRRRQGPTAVAAT